MLITYNRPIIAGFGVTLKLWCYHQQKQKNKSKSGFATSTFMNNNFDNILVLQTNLINLIDNFNEITNWMTNKNGSNI